MKQKFNKYKKFNNRMNYRQNKQIKNVKKNVKTKTNNLQSQVNKLAKAINNINYHPPLTKFKNSVLYANRNNPSYFKKNHEALIVEYIADVLDPEIAVTQGKQVKQPNIFPIPSATVGFRNHLNISTDDKGDFFIAWNPNYLVNQAYLNSMTLTPSGAQTFHPNTYFHLVQKYNNETMQCYPSYVPDVAFSKYRLVSAKIKVSYIGSVLNKSGMLYACATYDQTPVGIGNIPEGAVAMIANGYDGTPLNFSRDNSSDTMSPLCPSSTYAQTFKNLSEQSIANGIWNQSVNVTNHNQGISCTHVPSDPTNEIFYPTGEYFGFDYSDKNNYEANRQPFDVGLNTKTMAFALPCTYVQSNVGSQLCFLIMGHGLPEDSECVNIQLFYNFEIIPTTQSAPFIRSSLLSDQFNLRQIGKIKSVITEKAPSLAIRKGTSSTGAGILQKIIKYGTFAASVAKLVSTLSATI